MKTERIYLSSSQAAKYLGVSRQTLSNWIKKDIIKPDFLVGSHRRFSISTLENIKRT